MGEELREKIFDSLSSSLIAMRSSHPGSCRFAAVSTENPEAFAERDIEQPNCAGQIGSTNEWRQLEGNRFI